MVTDGVLIRGGMGGGGLVYGLINGGSRRSAFSTPSLSSVTVLGESCYDLLGLFATFWRLVVSQRSVTTPG